MNTLLRVHQSFSVFSNLTETGEYRFQARAGANLKIHTNLAVTLLITNRFLSNPVEGNQKNDVIFSTGLQFNWAQQ